VVGDVYISAAVARQNAADAGCPWREEVARLVVHGVLHTLGWDHPAGEERLRAPMWRRQERVARLNGAAHGDARRLGTALGGVVAALCAADGAMLASTRSPLSPACALYDRRARTGRWVRAVMAQLTGRERRHRLRPSRAHRDALLGLLAALFSWAPH
jgi:hypothetical protein